MSAVAISEPPATDTVTDDAWWEPPDSVTPTDVMVADSSNVASNMNGYAHGAPDTLDLVDRQLGFHEPESPFDTPTISVLN